MILLSNIDDWFSYLFYFKQDLKENGELATTKTIGEPKKFPCKIYEEYQEFSNITICTFKFEYPIGNYCCAKCGHKAKVWKEYGEYGEYGE